jgi:hypothetical protein
VGSAKNTAIRALLNKEMIYREDGQYKVYDVFFARWLVLKNIIPEVYLIIIPKIGMIKKCAEMNNPYCPYPAQLMLGFQKIFTYFV